MTLAFLDTNILLYSVSREPAEAAKRERAVVLLDKIDGAVSVQVMQEFYVQATRLNKRNTLSHRDACDLIEGWSRFEVQDMTMDVLNAALELRTRTNFSYWDCAIIAAARMLGCKTLYTEDLNHGQVVDGVEIVNPFSLTNR